jgi:hypothetical protein
MPRILTRVLRLVTRAAAAGICVLFLSGNTILAQQVDMTTLYPEHANDLGQYVSGISPYYSQQATATTLQIVGNPNLPNALGTHNYTTSTPLTGDFSAVITAAVSPNAGGSFNANFNGTTYAGGALGEGQVHANYGDAFGNVNTGFTDYNTAEVVFDLTRSGNTFKVYASSGGPYVDLVTLVGSSVSGAVGFDLDAWGIPGVAVSETTTYSNFYVTGAGTGSISGLTGGTESNPLMLPATVTTSIGAEIGGPSDPTSDFYSFYWQGGNFAASVGVPGASGLLSPPSYQFELCQGTSCVSPLEETIADSGDSWESSLSGNLIAGFYTVGVTDLGSGLEDPNFIIAFDTPIEQIASIPESSTWVMMLLGFAGLGLGGYRGLRKNGMVSAEIIRVLLGQRSATKGFPRSRA